MAVGTVFTIIAAIIAAGAAVTTTAMENSATEEAGKESEYWANLSRQDQLAAQGATNKLNKWNMRLKEKTLAWQKEESKKARAERAEERGYVRRQTQWGKLLGVANQNKQVKDSLLAYFPRTQPVGA